MLGCNFQVILWDDFLWMIFWDFSPMHGKAVEELFFFGCGHQKGKDQC